MKKRHYNPWTKADMVRTADLIKRGVSITRTSIIMERTETAVKSMWNVMRRVDLINRGSDEDTIVSFTKKMEA